MGALPSRFMLILPTLAPVVSKWFSLDKIPWPFIIHCRGKFAKGYQRLISQVH